MSTTTKDSVIVYFDPTAINKQSDIISGATRNNAGAMTAAQARELAHLGNSEIVTLQWTGAEPLDGGFPFQDVTWVTTTFPSAAAYGVFVSPASASGPVSVWEKPGARTATGTRILASDQFVGTNDVEAKEK